MLHRQTRQPKPTSMKVLSNNSKKALTQLALEGIFPSEELLIDMELLDSGQINDQEYKRRAIARATSKS